jgi:cholesterol transport system auxiliary component
MMKVHRLPVIVAAALAASGCFGGAKAPDYLLDLTPSRVRPAATGQAAPASEAVVVSLPAVPEELEVTRIPVRSGGSITYLKEAQWIAKPAALFARLLSDTVAAGGRVVLESPETAFRAGTVLSGSLDSFGVDADRREAVVIYDAALATNEDQVRTRRFEARVPLASIDQASVPPALNQAANQVAAEVAAWLGG